MAEYLYPGNSIDAVVEDFHTDEAASTPITDATFTWSLTDTDGNAITGCTDVPMTHSANGNYRGGATPTTDLTAGSEYIMTITCSNYDFKRIRRFRCINWDFDE